MDDSEDTAETVFPEDPTMTHSSFRKALVRLELDPGVPCSILNVTVHGRILKNYKFLT